jgi:hypothetical protein
MARCNRRSDQLCRANRNDLLLDHALESFDYSPQEPASPLEGHRILKLFKPHGSVDWARVVKLAPEANLTPKYLIKKVDTFDFTGEFVRLNAPAQADGRRDRVLFPAIAIPVQNKTGDTFACPHSHLTDLMTLLPSVTKILIIGWQAREAHFLEVLRRGLIKGHLTHLMVVGSYYQDASATMTYFTGQLGSLPANSSVAQWGFSQFVLTREGEAFFRA